MLGSQILGYVSGLKEKGRDVVLYVLGPGPGWRYTPSREQKGQRKAHVRVIKNKSTILHLATRINTKIPFLESRDGFQPQSSGHSTV